MAIHGDQAALQHSGEPDKLQLHASHFITGPEQGELLFVLAELLTELCSAIQPHGLPLTGDSLKSASPSIHI